MEPERSAGNSVAGNRATRTGFGFGGKEASERFPGFAYLCDDAETGSNASRQTGKTTFFELSRIE
jgi:hypothetical protein